MSIIPYEYVKFHNFINSVINTDTLDDIKMYLNGYTTFLITLKKYHNDIKNMRMNLLIDYYYNNIINKTLIDNDMNDYCLINIEKSNYINYYKEFITDDFKLELNINNTKENNKENNKENDEEQDEDTLLHYKDHFSRHLNYEVKIYNDNEDNVTDYSSMYNSLPDEYVEDTYSQSSLSYDDYYDDYISEEEY